MSGDSSGIFPICPFPVSRRIKQRLRGTVPKGSATQSGPFPKKVGNLPGLETHRFSFSQLASSCQVSSRSHPPPLQIDRAQPKQFGFCNNTLRAFGEGVKSARGETAILGRGDHARNMFGTSLQTTHCKQSIALETAERMQYVLRPLQAIAPHELLHELFRQQTTIAATPLAESAPSLNS